MTKGFTTLLKSKSCLPLENISKASPLKRLPISLGSTTMQTFLIKWRLWKKPCRPSLVYNQDKWAGEEERVQMRLWLTLQMISSKDCLESSIVLRLIQRSLKKLIKALLFPSESSYSKKLIASTNWSKESMTQLALYGTRLKGRLLWTWTSKRCITTSW